MTGPKREQILTNMRKFTRPISSVFLAVFASTVGAKAQECREAADLLNHNLESIRHARPCDVLAVNLLIGLFPENSFSQYMSEIPTPEGYRGFAIAPYYLNARRYLVASSESGRYSEENKHAMAILTLGTLPVDDLERIHLYRLFFFDTLGAEQTISLQDWATQRSNALLGWEPSDFMLDWGRAEIECFVINDLPTLPARNIAESNLFNECVG